MLLLLLSTFDVNAQTDSLIEQSPGYLPPDSLSTCYGVKAKAGFAVRYDQFAQVFFRTEIPSFTTNFIVSSTVNPSLSFDVDTLYYGEGQPAELLFKLNQVNLNELFFLSAENACGDTLTIGEVSTSPSNTSTVSVSHELFFALERESGDTSLYEVLERDSSVIFEEKLSFIQKYFFNDSLFAPTTTIGGIIDTLPINHSGVLPCYCKVIKGRPILEPFELKGWEYFGSTSGPPYIKKHSPYVLMHDEVVEHGDWKTNQSLLHTGPAKYINNWSEGKCTGSKYAEVGTGPEYTSPYYTSLLFNWSCSSGPYGEWCDDNDDLCEKQVNYSVKYDTRLQAKTRLLSTTLCGGNGTRARAEDYAALVLKDDQGNFEVLEVGRAGVVSTASKSYSKDWYITIVDFSAQILRIALGDQFAWADLIEPTAELIDGMINTSYVEKDGADHIDQAFGLINNNTGTFTLKPNIVTELMLISSGTTEVPGYTGWKSYGRINSNFRLAAGVPAGIANAPSEYCCSDGFSTWSLGSIDGAPTNYPSLFNSVDAFLYTLGLPYDGTDLGSMESSFNCPTGGPGEVSSESRGTSEEIQRLNNRALDYYQLFDVNGRLVNESTNYKMVNENMISIRKPRNPGMYFIVAHLTDGSFLTSKAFVSSNHPINEIYVTFK